ncbi:MAG: hypothetical protein V7609_2744 [Verrucomicrobiota bacterium]
MSTTTVSCILATLALVVSVALFLVHYRNQIERRHGEIIQLRTQIISSLSALQQRLGSLRINGELIRLELRCLPDSDDKYQTIERLPRLLSSISDFKVKLEDIVKTFEAMQTQKANRTAILLRLQSQASSLPNILSEAQDLEGDMLSLLTDVRKRIEA